MGGYNVHRLRVVHRSNVWLRCVSGFNSTNACNVNANGNANNNSTSNTGVGVAP